MIFIQNFFSEVIFIGLHELHILTSTFLLIGQGDRGIETDFGEGELNIFLGPINPIECIHLKKIPN